MVLIAGRGARHLKAHRQFVGRVDNQMQFVAEPLDKLAPGRAVLVCAAILFFAPIGIYIAATVGRSLLVFSVGKRRDRLRIDRQPLSEIGQQLCHLFHQLVEECLDLVTTLQKAA